MLPVLSWIMIISHYILEYLDNYFSLLTCSHFKGLPSLYKKVLKPNIPLKILASKDQLKEILIHLFWKIRVWNIRVSTRGYLVSDVIFTTKTNCVLKFLSSVALIFQFPVYFKIGVMDWWHYSKTKTETETESVLEYEVNY